MGRITIFIMIFGRSAVRAQIFQNRTVWRDRSLLRVGRRIGGGLQQHSRRHRLPRFEARFFYHRIHCRDQKGKEARKPLEWKGKWTTVQSEETGGILIKVSNSFEEHYDMGEDSKFGFSLNSEELLWFKTCIPTLRPNNAIKKFHSLKKTQFLWKCCRLWEYINMCRIQILPSWMICKNRMQCVWSTDHIPIKYSIKF